jgi:hypothetical protein
VGQIGIGLLNVLLLAPVWLQILHVLVADTIRILLVPVRSSDPKGYLIEIAAAVRADVSHPCSFLPRLAEPRGTHPIAEIGGFELRYGWRKSLAHIQKAI